MSNRQLAIPLPAAGPGPGRATSFELAGRGRPDAASFDTALERNRAFAAAGGHEGAVVFPNLRLFVITCLDPRVDPAHFLGLGLSDAMVVRNVGGRVTPEVINDVAFIGQLAESVLPDGPLFEVAVIHHTSAAPARSPTTRSAAATPSGSAPTSRRCASTLSSTPPRPSPATSNAFARRRGPPTRRCVRTRLRRGNRPGRNGHPAMTDHDPCPVCGKPRRYLMETHPDMPGLAERLRGVNGQTDRWVLTGMLSALATAVLAGTNAVLHIL